MVIESVESAQSPSSVDWDQYARDYDTLNLLRPYRELLDDVLRHLDPAPGARILDAACGTGNVEQRARELRFGEGCSWHGVDGSSAMLHRAVEKCAGMDARFERLDLDEPLPMNDGSFDHVVSVNTLYAMKHPGSVVAEFRRVLRPGGQIIFVNPNVGFQIGLLLKAHRGDTGSAAPWLDMHRSASREREVLGMAFGDDNVTASFLNVSAINRRLAQVASFHFYTSDGLARLVGESGLTVTINRPAYADQATLLVATR
jgi:ubiquinone/menaquinone biosynthesis C-methylase UbiE